MSPATLAVPGRGGGAPDIPGGEHQNKVNARVGDGERGFPSPAVPGGAGAGAAGAGRRRGADVQWELPRGGGFSILSADLPPGRLLLCPQHAPARGTRAELRRLCWLRAPLAPLGRRCCGGGAGKAGAEWDATLKYALGK